MPVPASYALHSLLSYSCFLVNTFASYTMPQPNSGFMKQLKAYSGVLENMRSAAAARARGDDDDDDDDDDDEEDDDGSGDNDGDGGDDDA